MGWGTGFRRSVGKGRGHDKAISLTPGNRGDQGHWGALPKRGGHASQICTGKSNSKGKKTKGGFLANLSSMQGGQPRDRTGPTC